MANLSRPDWTAVYYHRADSTGIGFDRTERGTNAIKQYCDPLPDIFGDVERVPEEYLLWFHHVSWDHKMDSERTLWEELVHKYYRGVEMVRDMQATWASVERLADQERYEHVKALLQTQEDAAVWWRDTCVLYFQTFSDRPIPEGYEKPKHSLEYYKKLEEIHHITRF